jgi:predicted DCC family thiol-disulfide oxidoreductase YuxK
VIDLGARPVFLYDADCAACSRFMRMAAFFDPTRSVDFVSIAQAGSSGLLDLIPSSQWYASSRMIDEDGAMSSGGEAMVALLEHLLEGRASSLLTRLPFAVPASRRLYGVLSRLHGDSCSIHAGNPLLSPNVSVASSIS